MTRGTLYLILPEKQIIQSCEFNGDMYGSPKDNEVSQQKGHYRKVMERLARAETKDDFIREVKAFDLENFNYQSEEGGYFRFYEYGMAEITNDGGEMEANKKSYFDMFFSDYLYFKNASGQAVTFRDARGEAITVRSGEIITFYFGEFIEKV